MDRTLGEAFVLPVMSAVQRWLEDRGWEYAAYAAVQPGVERLSSQLSTLAFTCLSIKSSTYAVPPPPSVDAFIESWPTRPTPTAGASDDGSGGGVDGSGGLRGTMRRHRGCRGKCGVAGERCAGGLGGGAGAAVAVREVGGTRRESWASLTSAPTSPPSLSSSSAGPRTAALCSRSPGRTLPPHRQRFHRPRHPSQRSPPPLSLPRSTTSSASTPSSLRSRPAAFSLRCSPGSRSALPPPLDPSPQRQRLTQRLFAGRCTSGSRRRWADVRRACSRRWRWCATPTTCTRWRV